MMAIHEYLRIDVFVWALVVYGIRYYQSASMDCSGDIQKIHMRKIRQGQGQSTWWKFDRFHAQRTLDKPKWTSPGPGVRADAQCHHTTWLEELASESNTIQAQEDIVCQGRLQAISRWNYMYVCDGYSSISLDWSIRLGSRLVWCQILSVQFHGLQRGHP